METCRTCAKCDFGDETNWLDLFHPVRWEAQIQSIRTELNIWDLQIKPNDGLPQKICTDCFNKLCTVSTFRRECLEAQQMLRNLFENMDEQNLIEIDLDEDENSREKRELETTEWSEMGPEDFGEYSGGDQEQLCGEEEEEELVEKEPLELNELPNEELTEISNAIETHNQNDVDVDERTETAQSASSPAAEPDEPNSESIVYITLSNSTAMDNIAIIQLDHQTNNNNTNDLKSCQSVNPINIQFECKYCYKPKNKPGETFDTQEALLEHISRSHDAINPFGCPQCDQKFQDAPSRTVHLKDRHVQKEYKCEECGKKYADRFNLQHHVEKYHSKDHFACPSCDKKFPSRKSLKYHSRWHLPERQLQCGYCDRLFISERQMKVHEATHTGIRTSEYCTFCGKSFFHIKNLRWHIYRKHGGDKPFKCAFCTEVFASYKEKRLHMLEFHAKHLTAMEKSQCMICHKRYTNEMELKEHMNIIHPENSIQVVADKRVLQTKKEKKFTGIFQCESCPQRFNLKSALSRHSAVHNTEGRPHVCAECKKRFKRVQDLRWHMKTHSEEKPNVCDVCGKGFALKYVLTQHRKSHEALEKSFQCATCGRTYLFEKSLRLHERVHTGKTYYTCDLCDEKFVTHIKFLCHMRKTHSTNNTENQETMDDDEFDDRFTE